MLRTLAKLQEIDVRWLYLALIGFVVLAYFGAVELKLRPSPEAVGFFNAIEKLDGSKPVLLHSDWDQGTVAELSAQFENTVRHLFEKDLKFVLVSGIATGMQFAEPVVNRLAVEYGKEYGRDWVSIGFKLPDPKGISIEAIARDFRSVAQKDMRLGKPMQEFPWLRRVRTANDWSLVISIAYTEYREYITYFTTEARVPYICGICAISSTPLYPFFNAGNIKGMLVGVRGGSEYERRNNRSGFGTKMLLGQTAGHLLLLVGILIGNLGQWAKRRLARAEANP